MTLKEMRQTRRAGLLNVKSRTFKCEGERNDHMLHYEQVFGMEFTECQTPRKKLQSPGISPVSLHAFMKTLKSNISEVYKVQVDCLKNSESDSYDKNGMKEKVNDLVMLNEIMQEKLKTASYSKQI